MMISKKVAVVVSIICIVGIITVYGCVTAKSKTDAAPAEEVPTSENLLYEMEVKPLTTAECGQCHFPVFDSLRSKGGKHRFDCVRCHAEFHVYSPRKQNYEQIMPKCSSCHLSASGGAFHGENKSITPCLNCHADPHKPLQISMADIEKLCGTCHAKEGNEINKYQSKHSTEVACFDCHAEKHGHIPECSACHESHSPEAQLTAKDCMTCHPVHKPTQMSYGAATASIICAGCHSDPYDLLQKKETKHTAVRCAECHPKHKEIPPCGRCHGKPHSKKMLSVVTKCGDCHSIAHDLAK